MAEDKLALQKELVRYKALSDLQNKYATHIFYETLAEGAKNDNAMANELKNLNSGVQKTTLFSIYSIFRIDNNQKPKMFDTTYDKAVGQHKAHGGVLPKGTFFVPAYMSLKAAAINSSSEEPSKIELSNVLWENINQQDFANLVNGEITFGKEGSNLVRELSCRVFTGEDSTFKLEKSIILEGGKQIKGEVEMFSTAGLPTGTIAGPPVEHKATYASFTAWGMAIAPN